MIEFENIVAEIKNFTAASELNRSVDGSYLYFDEPLVACADVDDPIFAEIKDAVSPEYLTPAEWLRLAGDERALQTGTVISWVLPVSKYVRDSNRREKNLPSEPWAHVRFFGEKFNQALREYLTDYLQAQNFLSIAPVNDGYGVTTPSCGLCQTRVPCEYKIPD